MGESSSIYIEHRVIRVALVRAPEILLKMKPPVLIRVYLWRQTCRLPTYDMSTNTDSPDCSALYSVIRSSASSVRW